jgi:2,4-dienoyl-CoA reductase-like NADH-dependent reductase (Old Yellow Enzyme family)
MEIDGIDPSQIESLQQRPFLEPREQEVIQPRENATDAIDTAAIEELAQQAQELPENRPEVVSRGRELLADPSYPSADIEEQVAEILLGIEEEAY